MNAQPIVGPATSTPSPIAAGERVQQLQALIAQVQNGAPTPSFAATLNAAQTAPATASSALTAQNAPASYPPSLHQAFPPTASAAPSAPSTSGAYEPLIAQAAARYGVNPAILSGLIEQESGFDPTARSSSGALGLTQLMPSTAASLGVTEPLDPTQSIAGGARYLSEQLQRFGGNVTDALAAYNAGPGAVQSHGGVPPYPETQEYVSKVLGYAAAYQGSAPTTTAMQMPAPTMATAGTIA
jgi:soluble lytic murein transglycosylase-like protein